MAKAFVGHQNFTKYIAHLNFAIIVAVVSLTSLMMRSFSDILESHCKKLFKKLHQTPKCFQSRLEGRVIFSIPELK